MKPILLKKFILIGLFSLLGVVGCSSGPKVKQQAYAKLPEHRVLEYELPVVWKGIELALKNHKIVERDPDEVDELDLKKLTKRSLKTDWIYSQSHDKYHEYKINDSPRKKYLQVRYRYSVRASSVMGGTEVNIDTDEEIEKLKSDGTSVGYDPIDNIDPTLPWGLLDIIELSILAAPSGT